IGFARLSEAESAAQFDARTLYGGCGLANALDGSNGHETCLSLSRALRPRWREFTGERGELFNEVLQERPHPVIGYLVMGVDQLRLELNIGLPAHELKAKGAEDRAQVLLGNRRRDSATRGTDGGSRFASPRALAPRSSTPVDRVLEYRRNR